jgi:hypothetical protein
LNSDEGTLEAIESSIREGLAGLPLESYRFERRAGSSGELPYIFEVAPKIVGAAEIKVATDLLQMDIYVNDAYFREFTWTRPAEEDLESLTGLVRAVSQGKVRLFRKKDFVWAEVERNGRRPLRTSIQLSSEFWLWFFHWIGIWAATVSRPNPYFDGAKDA